MPPARARLERAGAAGQSARVSAPSAAPACPTCGDARARLRYRLTRERVVTCRGCGLVYLWPQPSPETVRAIFEELYATGGGSLPELRDYYRFTFDDAPDNPLVQCYEGWLDAIERHHAPGRIADVGCGTGLFLAVARRRGWAPFGVDDSADATRHARERFGIDVHTGAFEDLARSGRRFDVVTMWDVIEHARDPVGLLGIARRCLAPGGILALATPNQRNVLDVVAGLLYRLSAGRVTGPLEKFYIPLHFTYFTAATLGDALARAGFGVVAVRRELTDTRRLALAAPVRLVVQGLFAVARLTRLENRLFVIARPEGPDAAHGA
jgi:SAM-dependent methyltransferase